MLCYNMVRPITARRTAIAEKTAKVTLEPCPRAWRVVGGEREVIVVVLDGEGREAYVFAPSSGCATHLIGFGSEDAAVERATHEATRELS